MAVYAQTGEAVAPKITERPGRIVRVVRRPRRSTWLYWLTEVTRDLTDKIDETNQYLEQGHTAKAAEAFTDVLSPRRLAVLLPGGGVLRGARRPPAPFPAVTRGGAKVQVAVPAATPPAM